MDILLNEKIYLPLIYIVIGMVSYSLIKKIINRISRKIKTSKGIDKRKNTIVSLINNLIKYIIAILIVLSILGVYGIDTTSILASLGIAAAIIGLAFQDIAKDLINGISFIFDNEYAVGDYVKINNFEGEVLELGLRTTKIRAYTGETLIISNSLITEVINYSLVNSKLVLDINVSYNTDIDKLEKVLGIINKELKKDDNVINDMLLLGINDLSSSSLVYRIAIECKPTTQFALKRKVLRLIIEEFRKNNIEIPKSKLEVNVRN